MHPSMPNAAVIEAAIDDLEERGLKPFFEPGNLLTRNLYVDLPLPWTLTPPVADFDETVFFRKEWGPDNNEEFFAGGGLTADFDTMERVLDTMSPVQRRREAYPDAVGTERDVIRIMRREIKRLLHEAGVEKGKEGGQGKSGVGVVNGEKEGIDHL